MKKSAFATPTFLVFAFFAACGGGDGGSSGDGDGDVVGDGDAGDGDAVGDGDAPGDGDGDVPGDGDGDGPAGGSSGDGGSAGGGAGGATTGGAPSTGGSPSTGGAEATGGVPNGSGGLPGICECDAPSIPVCGVDGTTYDAGCGDVCVPVEIDCQGVCPCAGCGCEVLDGNACDARERAWVCNGSGYDPFAFEAEGCESLPTGSVRYCCSTQVTPDDFCE